jgi:hypothetical protein
VTKKRGSIMEGKNREVREKEKKIEAVGTLDADVNFCIDVGVERIALSRSSSFFPSSLPASLLLILFFLHLILLLLVFLRLVLLSSMMFQLPHPLFPLFLLLLVVVILDLPLL